MRTSTLEDIGGVVGYTATRVIATWCAGRNLYVPARARPDHPLALLIGMSALRRLVEEFGSAHVCVPTEGEDTRFRRNRVIAEELCAGVGMKVLAERMGLSVRRLEQIRAELLANRWLEYAGRSIRDATTGTGASDPA